MAEIQFDFPDTARVMQVWINDDGSVGSKPVAQDQAILNLERDLIKHLSGRPFTDEWLGELYSYIGARIDARRAAAQHGTFAIPIDRTWSVSTWAGPESVEGGDHV